MSLHLNMNNNPHKINQKNGFTLLEVMIAMVIFAVGLLGLAGIQALSLENSSSSYSRSQAVLLAYEIVDRMKANNPSASPLYVITADTTTVTGYSGSSMCINNDCTISDIVKYDMGEWKAAVATLLLGGQASITNPSGTLHTVTIHWDEDRTGVAGLNCPPLSNNDLRCFQLNVQL